MLSSLNHGWLFVRSPGHMQCQQNHAVDVFVPQSHLKEAADVLWGVCLQDWSSQPIMLLDSWHN